MRSKSEQNRGFLNADESDKRLFLCRGRMRKLFCAIVLGGILSGPGLRDSDGQPSLLNRRVIQRVEQEDVVSKDTVRFENGDVLTGEVEQVEAGVAAMKPEMAENELAIPLDAMKEILFKDVKVEGSFAADRVVLVNGESVLARVEGMRKDKLSLLLPSSQRAELNVENVAAVAFFRSEEVLAEENFDQGLPEGVRFEGGRWSVRSGRLVQSDPSATECFACLPVTQFGDVVYEWSVNTAIGGSTGIYFLASGPRLSQERAYFVRVLRKYLYVYACINGDEVYCGSYRISLHKSINDVELRCDADRGLIGIWMDGTQVGLWKSGAPIRAGKYVILRADGRGAFDNLRIVRKKGAVRPEAGDDRGSADRLVLVNRDVIMAKVREISQNAVSLAGSDGEDLQEVEREKVLWVRFARELKPAPVRRKGTGVFLTRSGDRISGELMSLNEEVARMKSGLAGVLELKRSDLRKVIFRETP